jgi:hypothetical protein
MLGLPENSKGSHEAVSQPEHTVAPQHPPRIYEMKQAGLVAEPPPRMEPLRPSGEQERLIVENLPLVRVIAKRIYKLVPDQVSFEEIYCAGVAGLVGSLEQFDPTDEVMRSDFESLRNPRFGRQFLKVCKVWSGLLRDYAERGAPLKRRSTNWLRSCTVPLLNLKSRRNFK